MKKKKMLWFVLAFLACIAAFYLWNHREQSLQTVLSEEGIPEYTVSGYYDGMENGVSIVGAIPQNSITDLLQTASIRKGPAFRAMPSPCFELTLRYRNRTYRVIIGANRAIYIADIEKLDAPTFWVDTSGTLFERLYRLHIENGGQEFA